MNSTDTNTSTPQKLYNAPGVANLPYNQRPLPPGWISQYDSNHQAYFYVGMFPIHSYDSIYTIFMERAKRLLFYLFFG